MKHRSARTGRAVSAKEAKSNPETTVKESKAKDTLRLDWVVRRRADLWPNQSGGWTVQVIGADGEPRACVNKSLRVAIDAAMKAEKVK